MNADSATRTVDFLARSINNTQMKHYTYNEWMAEGERLYGEDLTQWRFVCPACGRVNSGQEFFDAGATPDNMAKTCIGRFRIGKDGKSEIGCNWAAYGLFGTVGKGVIIVMDDEKSIEAFAFG